MRCYVGRDVAGGLHPAHDKHPRSEERGVAHLSAAVATRRVATAIRDFRKPFRRSVHRLVEPLACSQAAPRLRQVAKSDPAVLVLNGAVQRADTRDEIR
jgi:hypothetical protein